jgi:hypothetical protein
MRALVLMRGLPPDSAFVRSYTGGALWGWTEEAAVTSVELLVSLIRITLFAHGAKKHSVPKPVRIPRPYELAAQREQQASSTRRKATVDETVSTLSQLFAPPSR